MSLSRREILAGLLASAPLAVQAAPLRPRLRGGAKITPPGIGSIFGQTGLGDLSSVSLHDLSTGRVLEAHRPAVALPPASVTKAVTADYAMAALGPGYRFRTTVAITGPIQGGRVQGDLYLIGDGDPHLDTDGLADLAKQVAAAGIFGVSGRTYVVSSAVPYHRSIDPTQPEHVGYNPAISGLNVNFNRVHFQWKRGADGYATTTTARSERYDPAVLSIEVRIVDGGPVFSYRQADGRDLWSVNRNALGREGARWLPVRTPDLYGAEVFQVVGAQFNLRLPSFRRTQNLPSDVRIVAQIQSAPAQSMLRAMMKYSTNLTAEIFGLRAHQARGGSPGSIAASAQAMTDWARLRYGLSGARFHNHSGLTDETRISSEEMARLLQRAESGPLPQVMKPVTVGDAEGRAIPGVSAVAKTGTLNFTRGLAGYLTGPSGRRMAFAIFAADLPARARATGERPRGARSFRNRAQHQERLLLSRWATLYGIS